MKTSIVTLSLFAVLSPIVKANVHANEMEAMVRRKLQTLNDLTPICVDGGFPKELEMEEALEGVVPYCDSEVFDFLECLVCADDCDADSCIDNLPEEGGGCDDADKLADDLGSCCNSQCDAEAEVFVECVQAEECSAPVGMGRLVSFGAAVLLGASIMMF